MKIQVTEIVKKEVEITTPCYVKSEKGYHFYHVVNEKQAVQIFNGMSGLSAGFVDASFAFTDKFEMINETEYKEVLEKALKKLSLLGIKNEEI